MFRIARDPGGNVHMYQITEAGDCFELDPSPSDQKLPDGLYDDNLKPISDKGGVKLLDEFLTPEQLQRKRNKGVGE